MIILTILVSILCFIIVFMPVRILKVDNDILGAFFFLVVIFYYVIIYNVVLTLILFIKQIENMNKFLFKSVLIFILHVYLILFLVMYLDLNGPGNGPSFITEFFTELFTTSKNYYYIFTALLGIILYYVCYCIIIATTFKKLFKFR